jgi:hypothetical protein
MSTWSVKIYYTNNGQSPFKKWLSSNEITKKDRANLEARIDNIQQFEGPLLPPEWLKKYKGTKQLKELKVKSVKKQLRPLCYLNGKDIIILCGAIEKDSEIPQGDLEKAQNLLNLYKKGIGDVKDYYEN